MAGHELAGVQVLVTRPVSQAQHLQDLILAHGGTPLCLPLLTITPIAPSPDSVPDADIIIFVSRNAVQHGRAWFAHWPPAAQLGVIGQGTAAALRDADAPVQLMPTHFDSETFLALPQVQSLAGQRVVIVRGVGGRETLASALRERGAQVDYLEVYQRSCPDWSMADMQPALAADIITITSGAALENLAQLAQQHTLPALFAKPLAVYHARIASRAAQLGFTLKPYVARQASDDALLDALLAWHQQQGV